MKGTRYVILAGALGLAACKSEEGAVLQIVSSPEIEADCNVAAAPTVFQSSGTFDPTGGFPYAMTLLLVNHANDQQNPAALPGDPNIKPSANDALIIGYDFCAYRGDDPSVTAYDPSGTGLPRDCDDVPSNARGFVTSGVTVPSDGGIQATFVDVLDTTVLQAVFGATFDAAALAGAAGDPRDLVTRSPAWGDFPAAISARVNVNVRARAKRQSGGTLRSNWYGFPVDVCPGCISSSCSAQTVTCPTGGTGLQGFKFSASSCSGAVLFSGGPFSCEAVDTCP